MERGSSGAGLKDGVEEVKRAEKTDRRVKERNNVGPTNVIDGIRNGNGVEEDMVAVVKNTIGRLSGAVPQKPPTASRVRQRDVVGVLTKEIAIVVTMGGAIDRSWIGGRRVEVDLDKIPARPQGTGWSVGNEEKTVNGRYDSGRKSSASGKSSWDKGIIRWVHGDGGCGRNGSMRTRERRCNRVGNRAGSVAVRIERRVIRS
jgi:hypothetical protein